MRKRNHRRGDSPVRPGESGHDQLLDEGCGRGLQPDALDLVVRCYARWSARTMVNGDLPYDAKAGQEIPAYVVLETSHPPVTSSTFVACYRRYSQTSRHPTNHDAGGPTATPPTAKALGCH